ncbi:glucose-6-phosphate dehydrogenase [Paenibacillus sp. HN-1]|uniref:glucose-6-phosphate dehydrogenase n=1 Tax=Paenibacillus TaxID=44249 RepID=UPI001CA7E7A2|nr:MULTISPECIES: glucose-6-phosphate dehydrogenase [Paenibacillus]MBY9078089.1 glucose-6-phosphate dehydrogenase [Paenibacillus sp. CGMCC 1.18879]MBY9083830.1 glucose-6-phosphate dehydrogenase [Paenibacillus sinensis]
MESSTFVLFGATGDLAKRKIYPALYNLFVDGKLPEAFAVFGLGRREWNDEFFRAQIEKSLRTFSRRPVSDEKQLDAFLRLFRYSVLDVGRLEDFTLLLDRVRSVESEQNIAENRMFYLSVGPEFFGPIAAGIEASGLGTVKGWKRLIIEKPFGRDLESARELNTALNAAFAEEEIFRIDHYLGKRMVQNLEVLEYSNPVLKALWTNRYIANVQITASETVGVEERAGYYDKSGALRDMFQNHMLQLLMMTAMQLPKGSSPDQVRAKKRHVMKSLRPLSTEEAVNEIVLGQYSESKVNGKISAGYKDEPGIPQSSRTETFIAARLWIDDPVWSEVPIYIRTGKKLKEKSTRIVIEFREPLRNLSEKKEQSPNLLIVEISPNEGITLQVSSRNPLNKGELEPIRITYKAPGGDVPEAYENLLHDAFRGDATFFAHWDEVELSWQWVKPIQKAMEEGLIPLRSYPAGSNGPEEAQALLGNDKWWLDEETLEPGTGKIIEQEATEQENTEQENTEQERTAQKLKEGA